MPGGIAKTKRGSTSRKRNTSNCRHCRAAYSLCSQFCWRASPHLARTKSRLCALSRQILRPGRSSSRFRELLRRQRINPENAQVRYGWQKLLRQRKTTAPGSTTADPAKPPPQAPRRTSARSALRIALKKSNRPEGRPRQLLIANPETSSIGGFMKIRFHVRGPDEFLLGVRCEEELGRRYGCRSLRGRRLS